MEATVERTPEDPLRLAVMSAAQCVAACDAVRHVYTRLAVEIDRRKPICVSSGKCCNFKAYGHRLYVTTLELATFLRDLDHAKSLEPRPELAARVTLMTLEDSVGPACPLQVGRLCGVHSIRPFGCRIFFCDPSATDWQQQQYELFHAELKGLHERFEIPYFYIEWRSALLTLGITSSSS